MTEEVQRDLGRHDAEIAELQRNMEELSKDVKTILSTLAEARGGWKTLLLVAGVAGAVGAGLAKLGMIVGWLPK